MEYVLLKSLYHITENTKILSLLNNKVRNVLRSKVLQYFYLRVSLRRVYHVNEVLHTVVSSITVVGAWKCCALLHFRIQSRADECAA